LALIPNNLLKNPTFVGSFSRVAQAADGCGDRRRRLWSHPGGAFPENRRARKRVGRPDSKGQYEGPPRGRQASAPAQMRPSRSRAVNVGGRGSCAGAVAAGAEICAAIASNEVW